MLKLTQYMLSVGGALLVSGAACGYFGARGIVHFVANAEQYDLTFRVLIRIVVVPHVLLLAGIGFVIYGCIMVVKGIAFEIQTNRRQAED